MYDKTLTDCRCQAERLIQTKLGNVPRGSFGTIQSVTESLGRHLVLVKWDNGIVVNVFLHEIKIEETTPTIIEPNPSTHPT